MAETDWKLLVPETPHFLTYWNWLVQLAAMSLVERSSYCRKLHSELAPAFDEGIFRGNIGVAVWWVVGRIQNDRSLCLYASVRRFIWTSPTEWRRRKDVSMRPLCFPCSTGAVQFTSERLRLHKSPKCESCRTEFESWQDETAGSFCLPIFQSEDPCHYSDEHPELTESLEIHNSLLSSDGPHCICSDFHSSSLRAGWGTLPRPFVRLTLQDFWYLERASGGSEISHVRGPGCFVGVVLFSGDQVPLTAVDKFLDLSHTVGNKNLEVPGVRAQPCSEDRYGIRPEMDFLHFKVVWLLDGLRESTSQDSRL